MSETITGRLEFLRAAERLKDTLRSAHTVQGRKESAAEHTWRLLLFVSAFGDLLPQCDQLRLLRICIVHDLGEAVHGDIPAPEQECGASKANQERLDFCELVKPLPQKLQSEFLELWDEYDKAESVEAQVARAFDKLETLLQHTQGRNPTDFDYAFNLKYGRSYTDAVELASIIRQQIDSDTRNLAIRSGQVG